MPVCKFTDAYTFLKTLDSIPFSWPSGSGQWYFRGQASSLWGLVPTLFRNRLLPTLEKRQEFERQLLDTLKRHLAKRSMVPQRFLEDEHDLLALARHYGAPTRVLDWTRSPHVAAYFASEPVMEDKQPEFLSVFAVADITSITDGIGMKFQIVYPSEATNPNLQAQRGVLFVYDWDTNDIWRSWYEVPVEPDKLRVDALLDSRFIRFDLPRSEVWSLRQELRKLGIDGVSMFPGNAGFVQHAISEAWHVGWETEKSRLKYPIPAEGESS